MPITIQKSARCIHWLIICRHTNHVIAAPEYRVMDCKSDDVTQPEVSISSVQTNIAEI